MFRLGDRIITGGCAHCPYFKMIHCVQKEKCKLVCRLIGNDLPKCLELKSGNYILYKVFKECVKVNYRRVL